MKDSKIAIFIDAENLTQWLKSGGPEKLARMRKRLIEHGFTSFAEA